MPQCYFGEKRHDAKGEIKFWLKLAEGRKKIAPQHFSKCLKKGGGGKNTKKGCHSSETLSTPANVSKEKINYTKGGKKKEEKVHFWALSASALWPVGNKKKPGVIKKRGGKEKKSSKKREGRGGGRKKIFESPPSATFAVLLLVRKRKREGE